MDSMETKQWNREEKNNMSNDESNQTLKLKSSTAAMSTFRCRSLTIGNYYWNTSYKYSVTLLSKVKHQLYVQIYLQN